MAKFQPRIPFRTPHIEQPDIPFECPDNEYRIRNEFRPVNRFKLRDGK